MDTIYASHEILQYHAIGQGTHTTEDCGKAEKVEVVEEYVDQLCPKDCIYRMQFTPTTDFCAYCLVERELRGCPISECNRYKGGHKKLTIDGATLHLRWVITDDGD